MLRSLTSGISGMQQFQARLDVIGNNISNVNTTGYKSARVDFEDSFSQTLRASSPGGANSSAQTAMQVGSGVSTAAIRNQYTQGALSRTGVQTDLAISGEGFFVVKDAINDELFVTRAGDFRIDHQGYLVTNHGHRVQGYADASLGTQGDIRVNGDGRPATADPNAEMTSFGIDEEGYINVRLSDGTEFKRGQILLQFFRDPQALMKEGHNLYSGIVSAGALGGSTPTSAAPGTSGLGRIQAGALELSNTDLATEFSGLITTQRAYQASARIITTSDEILQELVNLKR